MTAKDLTIFIGYDSKEPAAAAVLAHSILTRASKPVYFMPLTKKAVQHIYTRPRGPTEATEFSMTRFLVPYLSGYEGWSLFIDCDMLCHADIWDLMFYPMADPGKAVYVCQHDYVPKSATKFLGQTQTTYPRKNWSSLMLFDNAQCKALTPEYVNTASGLDLHRFNWLNGGPNPRCEVWECEDEGPVAQRFNRKVDSARWIGSIPLEWNYLVGEANQSTAPPKLIHYTNGGPWMEGHVNEPYAAEWFAEMEHMLGGNGPVSIAVGATASETA